MYSLSLLFFLASIIASVSAIQFTSPFVGSTLPRGSDVQLTWSSVDTDAASFSVYLWNFKYYPPFYAYLKTVNTIDHTTNLTVPCDVAGHDGYQFNAIQGNNVYVIYAQSPLFNIDSTLCSFPKVGANPEGCRNKGQGTTATVTVTAAANTITPGASTVTIARSTVTVGLSTVTQTRIVQANCPPCYGCRK